MKIQGSLQSGQALAGMQNSTVTNLTEAARRASKLAQSGGPGGAGTSEELEKENQAADAFEGYFNTLLVKELRTSLPGGFFSGAGSDVYSAWFDQYVGGTLAQRDGLGIGEMIRTSLARKSNAEEVPDFSKGDRDGIQGGQEE